MYFSGWFPWLLEVGGGWHMKPSTLGWSVVGTGSNALGIMGLAKQEE